MHIHRGTALIEQQRLPDVVADDAGHRYWIVCGDCDDCVVVGTLMVF